MRCPALRCASLPACARQPRLCSRACVGAAGLAANDCKPCTPAYTLLPSCAAGTMQGCGSAAPVPLHSSQCGTPNCMQAMERFPPQRTELSVKFDAIRAMAIGQWECSGERDPALVRSSRCCGSLCEVPPTLTPPGIQSIGTEHSLSNTAQVSLRKKLPVARGFSARACTRVYGGQVNSMLRST